MALVTLIRRFDFLHRFRGVILIEIQRLSDFVSVQLSLAGSLGGLICPALVDSTALSMYAYRRLDNRLAMRLLFPVGAVWLGLVGRRRTPQVGCRPGHRVAKSSCTRPPAGGTLKKE